MRNMVFHGMIFSKNYCKITPDEPYLYKKLAIHVNKIKVTELTPMSDDADLTDYLWPIVCEMIKTANNLQYGGTMEL